MGGQIAKQKPPAPTTLSPTRSGSKKESVRRRDRRSENGKDSRHKYRSCPEVAGATPYSCYDSVDNTPRNVNVKIYRSYGNLDEFKAEKLRESRPDVRVYRRSTGNMSEMASAAGSGTSIHTTATTTRAALARSRSADRYLTTPNGMPRNLELWKMKGGSLDRHEGRVTTPSTTLSLSSTSNWESMASVCDFPGVDEVCRKVRLFEESFCHSLLYKFQSLDETFQLSKVSVARCHSHEVALVHYMDSADVPENLEDNHYFLTIPRAFYEILRHMRRTNNKDRKILQSIAKDIMDSLAFEVGKELSRMYEYQIVMLKEFVAIKLLAAHAADCVLEYVIQRQILIDRNSALRGVVQAKPPRPDHGITRFSVIVGDKETKWDLFDLFKKPGIRREVGLCNQSDSLSDIYYSFGWKFFSCRQDCDTHIFGYRGQLLEWDFANKVYKVHSSEKVYNEERMYSVQDVHQQYLPFHRLVSNEFMENYVQYSASASASIKELSFESFMKQEYGCGDSGHEFFVYRPLNVLPLNLVWDNAILENMDLTRFCTDQFSCKRLRRSCLVHSEFMDMGGSGATVEECDLSYSTLNGISIEAVPARRCRTAYLTIIDSSAPDGMIITNSDGNFFRIQQEVSRRASSPEEVKVAKQPSTDVNEARALQLTGAARRVSATETISQKRQRLKRSRLNQSDSSSGVHSISQEVSVLEAPPPAKYVYSPRRALSQCSGPTSPTTSPSRPSSYSQGQYHSLSRSMSHSMSHSDSFYRDLPLSRSSPGRQPYEPKVIVTSATNYGDATLRRQSKKNRQQQRRQMPNDIDFNSLVQPYHSVKGVPGAKLLDKTLARSPRLYGRDKEVRKLAELITSNHRMLVVTGCPGIGKSLLTLEASHQAGQTSHVVPVLVDCRAVGSASRLYIRLIKQLGVRFQQKHVQLLCSWLSAADKRLLIVFDNLDVHAEEDNAISSLFNALLKVDRVQIICTTRRRFPTGYEDADILTLGDLSHHGQEVIRDLVPDLPSDSPANIANACHNIPYCLWLVGQALRLADDPAPLYSSVVSLLSQNNEKEVWQHVVRNYDGVAADRLPRVLSITKAVLDNMSTFTRNLLRKLCVFQGLFDVATARSMLKDEDLEDILETLSSESWASGLLETMPDNYHVSLPFQVKCVIAPDQKTCENMDLPWACYVHIVEQLQTLCNKYHSRESFGALSTVWKAYDNVINSLMALADSPQLDIKTVHTLTSPRMAFFLHDAISSLDFTLIYERLRQAASEAQHKFLMFSGTCCLCYNAVVDEDVDAIRMYMDQLGKPPPSENVEHEVMKTFSTFCKGKGRWVIGEDREGGQQLVKSALDTLKSLIGLQTPLTVYVYEEFALMEKEMEHYQKARYYYNLIDFVAEDLLGLHPCLLRGYDSRREIWERQGLFSRAAGVARKSAEIALKFYGDHPLTAKMHSRWCECIIKSGDTTEAIQVAALALNIREQLLGIHLETALSNKMFAYLMLRKGQYPLAVKHGQRAFDMCQRLHVHKRFVKDIEIILGQAKRRQESSHTDYVRIETHRHSKSLENMLGNEFTTISTEV